MKYNLAILVSFIVTVAQAQALYEKGYFKDQNNVVTEGYIKVEDWSSLRFLSYMRTASDIPKNKPLSEIKEFFIGDYVKMVRATVTIDISGDEAGLHSYEKEPEWHSENLFLRVLVEGKVNLYLFEGDGLTRFFYQRRDSGIVQLVNKRYKTSSGTETNDEFRNTLSIHFNCADSARSYFRKISYAEEPLINHFTWENQCLGADPIVFKSPLKVELIENNTKLVNLALEKANDTLAKNKGSKRKNNRYFAIEINPLLRQLIDLNSSNNSNNNLFAIQYSVNSTTTGRGVNYGLTYGRSKFSDDSNNTTRNTIDRNFSFRIGYERKTKWGKKWIALHGYDLLISGSKNRTESSQNNNSISIESRSKGWGVGPRLGLMFNLGSRIFLGTETTYYLQYFTTNQEITNQPNSEQKSSNFGLMLPTTIFLIARLK
jgi:hypothetical protein